MPVHSISLVLRGYTWIVRYLCLPLGAPGYFRCWFSGLVAWDSPWGARFPLLIKKKRPLYSHSPVSPSSLGLFLLLLAIPMGVIVNLWQANWCYAWDRRIGSAVAWWLMIIMHHCVLQFVLSCSGASSSPESERLGFTRSPTQRNCCSRFELIRNFAALCHAALSARMVRREVLYLPRGGGNSILPRSLSSVGHTKRTWCIVCRSAWHSWHAGESATIMRNK